jgi:FtsP/CotA-like multicopper oxidase with cupredoxin domain
LKEVESVNHPFHLHGYQLFVTEMGQFPMNSSNVNKAREMFENRPMAFSFNPIRYPIKDTISIPFKGYTIFRFKADNPGWWLLHCHYGK